MAFSMSGEGRTLRLFNYDPRSGELTDTEEMWIPPYTGLPAFSTDIAPPEAGEGEVAVFNPDDERWEVTEDHRGKLAYDTLNGEPVVITE
ncbi:tail fiber assembly protein, partial [Enterobacter mori]